MRLLRHRLSNLPPRSPASKWRLNPRVIHFTGRCLLSMSLVYKASRSEQSWSKLYALPSPTSLHCHVLKHLLKWFCSKIILISLHFSLMCDVTLLYRKTGGLQFTCVPSLSAEPTFQQACWYFSTGSKAECVWYKCGRARGGRDQRSGVGFQQSVAFELGLIGDDFAVWI